MREKLNFCKDWRFHEGEISQELPAYKGAAYSQAKTERARIGAACRYHDDSVDPYDPGVELNCEIWKNVDLPHDYTILQEPKPQYNNARGYFHYENAWYRKHFYMDSEDREKRITLYFEAISGYSVIYLNGSLLKRNFSGYNSFEVDITDYIDWDAENVLAVYVDVTSQHEGWWYEGAGIYRPVWMIKTEKVSVDLWGVYIHPECGVEDIWDTPIEVTIRNDDFVDKQIEVKTTVFSPDGEAVGLEKSVVSVPFRGKATAIHHIAVKNPKRWDIESPNRYHVEVKLYLNGKEVDMVTEKYGYRTIRFDADEGFFLNERSVKIKGVCCHQDYGLTGRAVPKRVQRYRLKLLKEMGCNGYRTSHYAQPETTLEALDEMGFLVMDETRWFESSEDSQKQLEMLIKRDRNRPCVIFWSIANEEAISMVEQGVRIARANKAFVQKLDPTRPVMASICDKPEQGLSTPYYDVIGVNYNYDAFEILHEKYPQMPVVFSECCATASTRGWYQDVDEKRGYYPSYDRWTSNWFRGREYTWKFVLERPWVMGCYQWAGIEHRGETVWPRLCSLSGALDLYLQRKDAFYQNQSHWCEKPMVHLLPHWNWKGEEGRDKRVVIYSNCEKVALYLNDTLIGEKELSPGDHAEWQVAYEPGSLRAIGYVQGEIVAEDVKRTSAKAYALKLRLEDEENGIQADGEDVAILTCYCVDENGNEVPDASPEISFETNGLGFVEATGSDISDHVPPHHPIRKMRAGLCSVLVRAGKDPGVLSVYARAEGLVTGVLDVIIK